MADFHTVRDLVHQNDHVQTVELPEYQSSHLQHSRQTSRTPLMGTHDTEDGHFARDHPDANADQGSSAIEPSTFDRRKQIVSLLWPQSLRWLGTVLLSALLMMTIKIYQDKGNFAHQDKLLYNVIITGLSVGLGLNFFEAFKGSAKILRWRALADSPRSVRMLDLMLGVESLEKVFTLGIESLPTNFWISWACVIWILLNLAAQISVALLGLTYDVIDGTNWSDTYTQNGIVRAPNLTCYFDRNSPGHCPSAPSSQDIAHLYGEQSVSAICEPYNVTADVLNSNDNPPYYCRKAIGMQEFAYRFKEHNPSDVLSTFPHLTNRTISASSGKCIAYNQTNQTRTPDMFLDGDGSLFTYGNDSFSGNITIPTSSLGQAGTTYIYRGFNDPQHATENSCGQRCLWMWAYKNPGPIVNDRSAAFYQCPITINSVSNATNAAHHVNDDVALVAATSIALQGRWSPDVNNSQDFTQFQYYPFETPWEIHYQDTSVVGANMAEFAIGSISQMAVFNPPVHIEGLIPYLGTHLEIKWKWVFALFAGVIAVHFLLYVSAILAVRNVVVTSDSFLANARLLRRLLEPLGEGGSYLEGKELSHVVQQRLGMNGVIYGPKAAVGVGAEYELTIGQNVMPRNEWPNRRHPDGKYK